MRISCRTFTLEEIENRLRKKGIDIEKDPPRFYQKKCEMFLMLEGKKKRFVERRTWDLLQQLPAAANSQQKLLNNPSFSSRMH